MKDKRAWRTREAHFIFFMNFMVENVLCNGRQVGNSP
jgi:hypothetical protein